MEHIAHIRNQSLMNELQPAYMEKMSVLTNPATGKI